ncbi:KilA-N domain-containing protein [Thiobacter aerophilum]|uniref:KilA-N domain-containing protein n=1 Tax=Thiobacter aerophilum TaxID=3121275 RepID=A0ABV0EG88_9BURK
MLKPLPIAWIAWDTPERIAAHPAIKDGLGHDAPGLVLTIFANGCLKVSATRRPRLHLADAARYARAAHTWIEAALVSEPNRHLHRVADTLRKRLQLEGWRNLGNGVFEALPVEKALAVLSGIRDIAEPPRPPVRETAIPAFLRKEDSEMQENSVGALPALVIASTPIRQDDAGRFCLNDLHKAAGGENRHRPSLWLENQQTQELVEEIAKAGNPALEQNQPVSVIKGGSSPGTYVCKELVYAYAMWVSPKFHLTVIRAFDDFVMGRKPQVGGVLPDVVASAIKTRAWRLAEEYRLAGMRLISGAHRPGDEELFWETASRAMERLEEHLTSIARNMLASKRDPRQLAAWILVWKPEVPEWERRLH